MKLTGRVMRIALGVAVAAAAGVVLLSQDPLEVTRLEAILRDLGAWAPAAFIAIFAVATVLFLPGSLFGLTGGVLFGPLWGIVWNLIGATLGATLAFFIARYLAGDWVARKIGGRLQQIVQGVEAEGWRFVALMRLVPIVPFNLLNYALGLTRIRLSHYVLATVVCMVPGTAAYAWLGHAGREATEGNSEALRYGLVGLGLLVLVAFVPRIVRRVKEASSLWITVGKLKRRLDAGENLMIIDVREAEEFGGPLGHIPGAYNMPLPGFGARMTEISKAHAAATILVCRTDKRSAKAADMLRSVGGRNVFVLRGGMEEWSIDPSQG